MSGDVVRFPTLATDQIRQLVGRAHPASLRLEHPVHDPGVREQERLDVLGGNDEASEPRASHDVGSGRLTQQRRDLAEEAPLGERGELRLFEDDAGLPVDDDVHARDHLSASQDPLALLVGDLLEPADDIGELFPLEVGEERQPAGVREQGRIGRHRPRTLLDRPGGAEDEVVVAVVMWSRGRPPTAASSIMRLTNDSARRWEERWR